MNARAIPGYEGLYSVTMDGLVLAHEKTREVGQGRMRTYPEKWLVPFVTDDGYARVTLSDHGKSKTIRVHQLVAMTWIGPRPSLAHEVNHRDGVKLNNHFTNLEWVTRSENMRHAYATGLVTFNDEARQRSAEATRLAGSSARKIAQDEADEIRRLVANGMKKSHAARRYGLTYWSVRDIVAGKTYVRHEGSCHD